MGPDGFSYYLTMYGCITVSVKAIKKGRIKKDLFIDIGYVDSGICGFREFLKTNALYNRVYSFQ